MKSTVRCETPRCVATIAKYGELYHRVHDRADGDRAVDAQCEGCGGKHLVAGGWRHACKTCKTDVQPGQLVGLFVPHSCAACLDVARKAEVARGAVCRRCHKAYVDCCC